MADKTTFIKLDRNISRWRWYQDANTMRVFLDLLLTASYADEDCRDYTIHRGEVVTTYKTIAKRLKLSVQQVRTSIEHLISTGEITRLKSGNNIRISILSYDRYQGNQHGYQHGGNTVVTRYQHGGNTLPISKKKYKNYKKDNNNTRARAREDQPIVCASYKPRPLNEDYDMNDFATVFFESD